MPCKYVQQLIPSEYNISACDITRIIINLFQVEKKQKRINNSIEWIYNGLSTDTKNEWHDISYLGFNETRNETFVEWRKMYSDGINALK